MTAHRYDSTQIYNADPSQLQALLKGSGIEIPAEGGSGGSGGTVGGDGSGDEAANPQPAAAK
jgi:hypothetical protein